MKIIRHYPLLQLSFKPNRLVLKGENDYFEGLGQSVPEQIPSKGEGLLANLKEEVEGGDKKVKLEQAIMAVCEYYLKTISSRVKKEELNQLRTNGGTDYTYGRLSQFFKENTNSEWPLAIQIQWMQQVVWLVVSDNVQWTGVEGLSSVRKEVIDEYFDNLGKDREEEVPGYYKFSKAKIVKIESQSFYDWLKRSNAKVFLEIFGKESK